MKNKIHTINKNIVDIHSNTIHNNNNNDVNITKSLSQSPIIHNIVRISQQINKRKVIDDTKEVLSNNTRKFENWFGGKYYNYRSNNDILLSLPCPADNCKCEFFSHVFDNYDVNVKHVLLKNTLTGIFESQICWNWNDWNYVGDNSKNKKQSLKKIVALHFARSIYVNENPNTNLISTSEKLKVKVHSVNMITNSWQRWVSKEIIKLKK